MGDFPALKEVNGLKPWLILLNNFSHDLFTGLWFGSFIVLYIVRDYAMRAGSELGNATPLLAELNSFFYTFIWVSLFLICLTGLFRFLFDRRGDGGIGDNWQLKKQMLIVMEIFSYKLLMLLRLLQLISHY